MVQGLGLCASTSEGMSSIPGQRTKILHAAWHGLHIYTHTHTDTHTEQKQLLFYITEFHSKFTENPLKKSHYINTPLDVMSPSITINFYSVLCLKKKKKKNSSKEFLINQPPLPSQSLSSLIQSNFYSMKTLLSEPHLHLTKTSNSFRLHDVSAHRHC